MTGERPDELLDAVSAYNYGCCLRDIGKNVAHMALVHTVHSAEGALKLLVRWLGRIIGCVARDVRGKGRKEACFISLLLAINDLRRSLQWNRGKRKSFLLGGKEGGYQGVDKEVEPDADNLP
jgi:hypothetical protein